jgi:hypothetical protein
LSFLALSFHFSIVAFILPFIKKNLILHSPELPDRAMLESNLSAGSSAVPYVDSALLAIRKVGELEGVYRGLDSVMDF